MFGFDFFMTARKSSATASASSCVARGPFLRQSSHASLDIESATFCSELEISLHACRRFLTIMSFLAFRASGCENSSSPPPHPRILDGTRRGHTRSRPSRPYTSIQTASPHQSPLSLPIRLSTRDSSARPGFKFPALRRGFLGACP
jgi:hypothetical protein